jgi:hypothetical protein
MRCRCVRAAAVCRVPAAGRGSRGKDLVRTARDLAFSVATPFCHSTPAGHAPGVGNYVTEGEELRDGQPLKPDTDMSKRCHLNQRKLGPPPRGCQRSRTVGPATVRSHRMSHPTNALRAATAAALMGSFALAGSGTATADPNAGNSSDINTLASSLSKGYGLNNCQPPAAGQMAVSIVAELDCGQSDDPSGPASAIYQLLPRAETLASDFKYFIQDVSLTACGDNGQSPTTWHQGQMAGQVACGTYKNTATITWTTDSKNVLGYIRSSNTDVNSLYKWWQGNG